MLYDESLYLHLQLLVSFDWFDILLHQIMLSFQKVGYSFQMVFVNVFNSFIDGLLRLNGDFILEEWFFLFHVHFLLPFEFFEGRPFFFRLPVGF